ncbi:MAG: hypothetical protein P8Y95_10410 [Gammaproteobacteria bacterium]|jgi:hypothetical protein
MSDEDVTVRNPKVPTVDRRRTGFDRRRNPGRGVLANMRWPFNRRRQERRRRDVLDELA